MLATGENNAVSLWEAALPINQEHDLTWTESMAQQSAL